jgi:hypothetical protein
MGIQVLPVIFIADSSSLNGNASMTVAIRPGTENPEPLSTHVGSKGKSASKSPQIWSNLLVQSGSQPIHSTQTKPLK